MPFRDFRGPREVSPEAALSSRRAIHSPRAHRRLAVALIVIVVAVLSCVVSGQEKTRLPGEDWIRLFNGNDLSGWTKIGNESWTVEEGLIHGKGLTQDYGYLQTEKDYKDSSYRSALNAWVMAIAEFSFIVPSNPEPRTSPRVCSLRSTAK